MLCNLKKYKTMTNAKIMMICGNYLEVGNNLAYTNNLINVV